MNEDTVAACIQASIAQSHLEQATVLRERMQNRTRYLGEQNVALLGAMIMAHEAAASALVIAARESSDAAKRG